MEEMEADIILSINPLYVIKCIIVLSPGKVAYILRTKPNTFLVLPARDVDCGGKLGVGDMGKDGLVGKWKRFEITQVLVGTSVPVRKQYVKLFEIHSSGALFPFLPCLFPAFIVLEVYFNIIQHADRIGDIRLLHKG